MKTSEIEIWNQPIEVDGGWVICTVEVEPGVFRLRRVPQEFVGAQGIQGEQGIQGVQGDPGIQGPQGIQGIQGDEGRSAGLHFTFSSSTTEADPGSGFLRFNNTPLIATELYISKDDLDGFIGGILVLWDVSDSSFHATVTVRKASDPSVYTIFVISAASTDNGTWEKFPITNIFQDGSFLNGDAVIVEWAVTGDKGDTGATGATGSTGATGEAGRPGGAVAFPYLFNTNNSTTPGSGEITFDDNDLGDAQNIYVNKTDDEGNFNDDALSLPGAAGDLLFIYNHDAVPLYGVFEVLSHSVSGARHHYIVTPVATGGGAFSNGASIVWTFTKKGANGADGQADIAGLSYVYDTDTTAADPGAGGIKFNNATLGSATAMYISETDADTNAIAAYLATWDDGTSTIKGHLVMRDSADPAKIAVFGITGTLTDNGTWDTFTVTSIVTSGVFADGAAVKLNFIPTGDKGDAGANGSNGSNGTDGRNAGLLYTYDTTTTATDPGSGKLQFNNATLSSATALYISETDGDANALAAYLATWDDSTSTIRGILTMRKDSDPAVFAIFSISGTITDNGAWDTFTVAHIASNGSFSDNDLVKIHFFRNGDKGDTGATGTNGSVDWAYVIERAWDNHNGGSTSRGQAFTATTSANSPVSATANRPEARSLATSTTLNNSAYVEPNTTSTFFLNHNLKAVFLGHLVEITGCRSWIGLAAGTGATMFGSGTTPAVAFVGFRFDAGSDTNWQVVTYDGTNLNVVDTGVAPSTTTMQSFRVEFERNGSEVRFYIDGTLEHTATVQLPASGTALRTMMGTKNTVGGVGTQRTIVIHSMKYTEGIATPV